jgi:hypothetical protein
VSAIETILAGLTLFGAGLGVGRFIRRAPKPADQLRAVDAQIDRELAEKRDREARKP